MSSPKSVDIMAVHNTHTQQTQNTDHHDGEDNTQHRPPQHYDNEGLEENDSSDPPMDLLESALQQKLRKRDILLQKIETVRSKRKLVHANNASLEELGLLWMHRYNTAVKERTRALSSYAMHQAQLHELQECHEKLKQIYVLQDVFHIWHRGAYATINGLRLGMSDGSVLMSSSTNAAGGSLEQANSFWNNNHVVGSPVMETNVPWHEINAGLGMVALLMHTLQKRLCIFQPRYMIHPRGSTTKVLSRKTKQEWDLYHQPTAFQFFARRNWNAALNIMGYILVEIINEVNRVKEEKKIDGENWIVPFDVSLVGDWANERIGTVKIHGLDVSFNGDAIEWTKAMRYLAIDLKMIVALVATYVE